MKPSELFGVGIRLIGVTCALTGLPAVTGIMQGNYAAIGQVVVGLLLVTQADAIARLCYSAGPQEAGRLD